MKDQNKTKSQLIEELEVLRKQTDRLKKAEETILQVHRDWEDIFQAIGHPTIILDAQHNILSVNSATVKAAGVQSAKELIGRKCYEIFHNADGPPKGCPLVKMLASSKLEESEIEVEAFGGIFLVSCTPVFDEKGDLQKIIHIATDITERKKAEKALYVLSSKQEAILAAVPDIIMEVDANKVYTWANQAGKEFFGEDVIGKEAAFYFIGEQKTYDIVQPLFKGNENIIYVESWQRRKDGEKRLLAWWCRVLKDDRENVTGALSTARDITEFKRNEEALRISEERYRSLVENQTELVCRFKPDGTFIFVNDMFCHFFGKTKDELIGKKWFPLPVDEDIRFIQEKLMTLSPTNPIVIIENRVVSSKGDIHWVQFVNRGFFDPHGNMLEIQSVGRDITERKRAEDEIRKLNAELEKRVAERTSQFEASNRELENEIMERIQKEERIKRQNVLLEGINWIVREALTVETEEDLSSQTLAIAEELTESRFGFIHELNEAGTMDNLALTYPGGSVSGMPYTDAAISLKNITVRGIYPDIISKGISMIVNDPASQPDRVELPEGHPRLTAFLGVPLKQGEKVIGLIGLANKELGYDTDDQQAIEMVSIAFVEALTRIRSGNIIKTLNKELEQSIDEVSRANKELEAFSYSVSHDLRAPLRAIDGFAEILLREYSPKLDDEGKRICSIITGNSNKMGQLIDELLSLSRLGRAEMHFSSIDMNDLANAVYDELTTPEMRQRINFHLDDLGKASGDPILIRQVWMNLISNAVKFTSHNEQPVISITRREEEEQTVFCVKDNGAGFNMQYVGKLFGVFQRLHSEKEFEGTGVGLAIVQRIIHRHGGKVWAEGETDKGATFFFSLPK